MLLRRSNGDEGCLVAVAGVIRLAFSLTSLATAVTLMNAMSVHAAVNPWPSAFHGEQMAVSGGTQYVRVGGHGPAVLLLHGFGDTGDMWVPLAEILVKDHSVIVPDLRGMGLSSHQDGGYEKIAQAKDLASILDKLGIQEVALVTHDIGNMAGYALAALYPARVSR
jgi:pimeloyl-ACP methyl ester carboxylesterase